MRPIFLVVLLLASGCTQIAPVYRDSSVQIGSMALFEPQRYLGRWYEIASFPTVFQKGCTKTQAVYDRIDDQTLSVSNSCDRDGRVVQITGSAEVVGPGRLSVRFQSVPFAKSAYWVLWVDEEYQTAVVGTPYGRAGWILNRAPKLRADRLNAAKQILQFNGYDLTQLRMTPQ